MPSAKGSQTIRRARSGQPGLTYRVTLWEDGKEYRNDTEVKGDIRYIDICYNKSFALVGDADFKAYQCRSTHTSSTEDGRTLENTKLWEEINDMRPTLTAVLLAQQIKADAIDVNGLTVKTLSTTSDTSQKRIYINADDLGLLQVFDGEDERIRISGESVGSIDSLISEKSISGGSGSVSKTIAAEASYDNPSHSFDVVTTGTFSLSKGAFSLKDSVINVTLPVLNSTEQVSPDWTEVSARVQLFSSAYSAARLTFTCKAANITRSGSAYVATIRISSTASYQLSADSSESFYLKLQVVAVRNIAYGISSAKTCTIAYTLKAATIANARMTEIGNNGLYSIWGVNNFIAVNVNDGVQMRCGGVGLSLKGGALSLLVDGQTFSLSTDTVKDTAGNTITVPKLTATE